MMARAKIEAEIAESLGKSITVDFGNGPEIVRVVSVDPDGFVCHPHSAGANATAAEFWVAYKAVLNVTRSN